MYKILKVLKNEEKLIYQDVSLKDLNKWKKGKPNGIFKIVNHKNEITFVDFTMEHRVKDLLSNSFYSFVDYDYDSEPCSCPPGDYCRCFGYKNFTITSFNKNDFINHILTNLPTSTEVQKYCVERVLNQLSVDNFEEITAPGYYGEELRGVNLTDSSQVFCNERLIKILNLNDIDAIKYILVEEYGYLLPSLENIKSVYVFNTSYNELFIPNLEHYRRLDKNIVDSYKDRTFPLGVYLKENNTYKLVDGYHRYAAADKNKTYNIVVVEN